MTILQQLQDEYDKKDCRDLGARQLQLLRDRLKKVQLNEIKSAENGRKYIELLKKFREAVAENDKLHGENYPQLLNSLLSVGEDGLYSNSLRFIFELIQNVDDCDYSNPSDCKLDMQFDFENNKIILTYNETGFTPFNVFAITGIAEAAKNVSSEKNQIGEKGIGFKSVFGVANKVQIKSGWFSFELHKENFTIPVPVYSNNHTYCNGTQMTLYVPKKVKQIYKEIKEQYCKKEALFSRNPLLFLNKLTSLKFYFDSFRCMEFHVSRTANKNSNQFNIEREVEISVNLHDYENGSEVNEENKIYCTRYTYSVIFSKEACKARYGEKTHVGQENDKTMILNAVIPNADFISEVGSGALYSFLPTQLKLTVPIVCHVPFKLDASREFVDPQENNMWFQEASHFLSEMMDKVYLDYCHAVKEDIVRYLPNKENSLFAVNNGKEKCLTKQRCFYGMHYLNFPIFYTIDNAFKKSDEIFCFNESENIEEPEKVYKLMEYRRSLFISPIPVNGFSIKIEKNVKHEMFKKALNSPAKTADILEYLNSVNYSYSEDVLSEIESIKITQSQLRIILKYKKLIKLLQKICCDAIKCNKRFHLEVIDASEKLIADILKSEFNMSDVPVQIRKYLKYCHEKCICIDTFDDFFLPCHNAVILSLNNPLTSFASFCYAIDEEDTFAIRIKMRDASKKLNKCVEDSTISDNEYMRQLRQIRKLVKDSLGNEGYKSYLEIILKAGTNKKRFIQEILQNADDCLYAWDVTPSFSLSMKGNMITTEHNEQGFTRANIRSITAIGESTKETLLSNTHQTIGEKGVGFKTIFAIASKVTIHSGDYHFSLSREEPTIPVVSDTTENVSGTKMEIILQDNANESLLPQKENEILELCLCLRNLKKLKIGKYNIEINDTENSRTIKIGKNKHVFKRFCHNFTIENQEALEERRNGSREISAEQKIVCYIPEGKQSEFPLYCGLPTNHRIKIPMAVDAPFSLITSREEIEKGTKWNNIIREEMYKAILKVIDSLKIDEEAKVFRFIKFVPRFQGIRHNYVNATFDDEYLAGFDFLSQLQKSEILPTYDKDVFAVPSQKNAFRFPDCCIYIFDRISLFENASSIIKIKNGEFDSVLNALGCKEADFAMAFSILSRYAEKFIKDKNFRDALYEYLADAPSEYETKIKELRIIPVYETHSTATAYIAWEENSIFVKPNEKRSGEDYYVLNEEQMPKSHCEKIFKVNISEMNSDYERARYNERLKERICSDEDSSSLYKFLISEYRFGKLQKNESFDILSANSIPLKNQCDEITRSNLFICEQSGYFNTKMIMRITVHNECRELARAIGIKELKNIHYEDIDYNEELTADDIEMLIDEPDHYFVNYEEILRAFYRDGLLSDDLLQEYSLDYLAYDRYDADDSSLEFPAQIVGNREVLILHIKKLWSNPEKIITVEEMCKVKKIKVNDKLYSYDRNYSRNIILNRYSPEGKKDLCFCQMCHKVKPKRLIEVNNIELLPEYFFSELRIALCLECSKKFEALRNNDSIRKAFLKHIKEYDIHVEESKVEIPIGNNDKITFTAKHLAEIQEILKQNPNKR